MSNLDNETTEMGEGVLQNFITTYEELQLLWNPTDPNYKNKYKRTAALEKLLAVLKNGKPEATVSDVRRKINTLRCNYRKELRKIEDSKRSGAEANDVYVPTSWVFHALKFVNNFEQPVDLNSLAQLNEDDENQNPSSLTAASSVPPHVPMPKRAKSIGPIIRQNELLQQACHLLDQCSKIRNQIEIPTIAKAWGEKLLELNSQQRAFAEKAINDILFEASQGTLHRSSVRINEDQQYHRRIISPVDTTLTYELSCKQEENSSNQSE